MFNRRVLEASIPVKPYNKVGKKYELTPLEEKVFMTVFHFSRRDNTKEFLNMPENVREDFEKYIKTIYKNHPHISDYS